MSLDCETIEIPEDVGEQEICARLTGGDLAINISVIFITTCNEACGKWQGLRLGSEGASMGKGI